MKNNKKKITGFLILHLAIFVLSLASLCSKKASSYSFLSAEFILLYSGVIAALFVYAIVWQQVLKRMPLVIAFANKVATLFWSFIYGTIIFNENIRPNTIIGMLIVIIGVIFVISGEKRKAAKGEKE
jgi:drug/metabolite transporter (DMT)-like permease